MATQVALAIAVLIAAGVFLRSFLATRNTDPGFERDGVPSRPTTSPGAA